MNGIRAERIVKDSNGGVDSIFGIRDAGSIFGIISPTFA
jgi:hypothetical protein